MCSSIRSTILQIIAGAGHGRARNARGCARSRHVRRADRRRRADLGHGDRRARHQARDRADRGRGRALSRRCTMPRSKAVDLPLGGDTLAEGIAVKKPGAAAPRASSRTRATKSCWSRSAAIERAVAAARRSRRRSSKGQAPRACRRCSPIPSASRAASRPRAVRRQHRHAPARQRAAPRSCPRRAARAAPTSRSRSPRRARGDHAQVYDAQRQHHRNLPPAGFSRGCPPRTR